MKKVIILLFTLLLLVFHQHLIASTKVLLLISEQFPQIQVKPLKLLTNQPIHQKVRFGDGIVADIFLPNHLGKRPAVIISMGVRTNEKDRPILLHFADTLARLGYVVMWPRQESLDKELVKFEKPQTFIESFEYLKKRKGVDINRISFVGFSVGSSVAMVAAENPVINNQIRSFIFFGGYYSIFDYLSSLATKSYILNGEKTAWTPDQDGINHANGILENEGLTLDRFAHIPWYDRLDYHTKSEKELKLLQLSPDQNLENFKAPIFILHEKADNFVPFVESVKLNEVLKSRDHKPKAFHIANLFEHVQPKKGFSSQILAEFARLFGFLYKVFMFL